MVKASAASNIVKSLISTPQAKIAAVGYGVVFLMVLVKSLTEWYQEKINATSTAMTILLLLLVGASYALSVYGINCMVVGNCEIWAWINAIAVVVIAGIIALLKLFPQQQQ
jgi:hypothetical protein